MQRGSVMPKIGEKIIYLSRAEVESLNIDIPDILSALESMFREKAEGRVEMPPKPAIHTRENAFLHAMPAFIPGIKSAGVKWVGGYPDNFRLNLPYITGLLILNDVDTGIPYAVMDCSWITAVRTAAATAVTAKYLANKGSKTLAILGCGVQGRYNLEALSPLFGFAEVRVYDVDEEVSRRYREEMSRRCPVEIRVAQGPEAAVRDADIVVTAGPFLMEPDPVIEFSWIKPGALLCPLDLDSYFKPEVFLRSDFLCTDDLGQYRHFKKSGLFGALPEDLEELAQVVSGKFDGRKSPSDVISAINIGIALEDMSVAPLVYEKACEKGAGVWLDL